MEVLKISLKNSEELLKKVIKSIKEGKIIVFPTDTLYGLIADAENEKAVRKIFKIKKREKEKPIPIFVKNMKMAKRLAYIDKNQTEFLKNVWPGKITVILKTKNILPEILFKKRKNIGLRIPNYKLVNILLKKLNRPLTGTSANISGKPASGNLKKVLSQFKNEKYQPDLIIDAGNLPKRKPSTVLDLTSFPPKVLRP